VKLAPDEASVLLIISLLATFITIGICVVLVTGVVPLGDLNQDTPHTGSIDISVSENDEVKFEVTAMGNVDRFIIREPDGSKTSLVREGDSVAYNVEDGTYSVFTKINGKESLHQTVYPSIPDIDVSEHSKNPDGQPL
jgi:hypothetical protein